MTKKFLILAMFIFLIIPSVFILSSCSEPTNEKILLDMANARWNYNDNFEVGEKSFFKVEIEGLPKEVKVSYRGNTASLAGDYQAVAILDYDKEKYELININIQSTLKWKVHDRFFLDEVNKYENAYSGNTSRWFGTSSRGSINYIHFVNYLDKEKIELTQKTSQSLNGKKSPDYIWGENKNGECHVYIGFDSTKYFGIKMPEDCTGYFAYMKNLKAIYGLEYVDTKYVKNMTEMFRGIKISLNLSFDTSRVENMERMFYEYGKNSTEENLTLDLGNNFDTSNVKIMTHMFAYAGYDKNQTNFILKLGDKFSVRNATEMRGAFMYCGYYSIKDWDITIYEELKSVCVVTGVFSNMKANTVIKIDENSTYSKLSSTETGKPSSCSVINI